MNTGGVAVVHRLLRWSCGGVAEVLRWCCGGVAEVLRWSRGGVAVAAMELQSVSKFDQKIETTEHVVKAIENVAERVDKVIDSITDDLPDSNLKKALEHLDEIAEGVAKSAHAADDIIIKVNPSF
ncbi:hypothetical protein CTI12_AA418160 [Artemisia annua]|uniref:Uncharacterized protein n=1 Tax=Artemisia annua TaxID=35608 RepID=A0A2U1M6S9_ARTAN|nr:hypothetical protein CTI12_AA418160 [Artemisia annua]